MQFLSRRFDAVFVALKSHSQIACVKGDLDGTILPTIITCDMTTTRIASCKSTHNIFTTDAHNTKNVGTVLSHAIFCSARCLRQAKIAYNSHHITLYLPAIVVEKHVFLKSYDIFRVVCVCRKDVVG